MSRDADRPSRGTAKAGDGEEAAPPDFEAVCVTVDEDEASFAIAFADDEFQPQRYVMLQREKHATEQDIALGMDACLVEVDDPGRSCYGGVASLELHADRAVIRFEEDAVETLGGAEVLAIGFSLRPRELQQVRGCLARMFSDGTLFVDCSA